MYCMTSVCEGSMVGVVVVTVVVHMTLVMVTVRMTSVCKSSAVALHAYSCATSWWLCSGCSFHTAQNTLGTS